MAKRRVPFCEALLDKYQDEGVIDLNDPNVLRHRAVRPNRHAGADCESSSVRGLSSKPLCTNSKQRSIRMQVKACQYETSLRSIQNIMRQDAGVDGDAQRISQLCWMFFLKIIDDQDQERELFDRRYVSPIPEGLRWRDWAADPEGITGDALLDFVNGEAVSDAEGPRDRGHRRREAQPLCAASSRTLTTT